MVDLAYRLEVNEYNGAEQVQLNCQHFNIRDPYQRAKLW